jgi:multiple sugar transport system ATP-binding protein
MSLSDLIAVMRDGKIVQFGPTREIYRRPRDLYVATFVGKPKMSLVDGRLERGEGFTRFVTSEGLAVNLGNAAAIGLRDGEFERVALGVRAEDVKVHLNGSTPDPARTFQATIQLLEPIGSDTFVELAAGDSTIVARVAPDAGVQLGQTVTAELLPGRIHLFERERGERIIT